jgi:hypothetical protein
LFRSLRYRSAKKRLAFYLGLEHKPPSVGSRQEKHTARAEDFPPNTDTYGKLSDYWDLYAGWFVPRYGAFLRAATDYCGIPLR